MKNTRWSAEDFKKKGLIMVDGEYVKASSQVANKVEKLPNLLERAIQNVVKGEQERAANPNSPYVHYETECITLPNKEYERIYVKYSFELPPFPAPRMVRGDQWKTDPKHHDPAKRQRKPVTRYFAWRDAFRLMCKQNGYTLQETLRVLFIMPMPKYLSRKKRAIRNGQAHKQRPDTDNMLKSIKDSFNVDDGFVWDERGVKVWGEVGRIIIF